MLIYAIYWVLSGFFFLHVIFIVFFLTLKFKTWRVKLSLLLTIFGDFQRRYYISQHLLLLVLSLPLMIHYCLYVEILRILNDYIIDIVIVDYVCYLLHLLLIAIPFRSRFQ